MDEAIKFTKCFAAAAATAAGSSNRRRQLRLSRVRRPEPPALDRARAAHHHQQQRQCGIASPLLRAAMCFEATASHQFALIHYDAIAVRVRRPSRHEFCRRSSVGDRPQQAACVCIGWRLCSRSRLHSAGTQIRPTAVSGGVPCQLARQRWSAISMAVLYLVTSASNVDIENSDEGSGCRQTYLNTHASLSMAPRQPAAVDAISHAAN